MGQGVQGEHKAGKTVSGAIARLVCGDRAILNPLHIDNRVQVILNIAVVRLSFKYPSVDQRHRERWGHGPSPVEPELNFRRLLFKASGMDHLSRNLVPVAGLIPCFLSIYHQN